MTIKNNYTKTEKTSHRWGHNLAHLGYNSIWKLHSQTTCPDNNQLTCVQMTPEKTKANICARNINKQKSVIYGLEFMCAHLIRFGLLYTLLGHLIFGWPILSPKFRTRESRILPEFKISWLWLMRAQKSGRRVGAKGYILLQKCAPFQKRSKKRENSYF